MDENTPKVARILMVAWSRLAQYDNEAKRRNRTQLRLRRWVTILGVLATLFAILTETYPDNGLILGDLAIKVLLIATPIIGSVLAAFTNKSYSNGDWLILRAGAEEILKEIYTFRTILRNSSRRRVWLEKRLTGIQRQVYRSLGGEMVLKPYDGPIPPNYEAENPFSDPGFQDLTGDEYFNYRVMDQLDWHNERINRFQGERTRLQLLILVSGGASAAFAALGTTFGNGFSLWVAFTASLSTALIGWQELRNLDSAVRNYSEVIMELNIIHDHWSNLEPEERSNTEFYRMVRSTEDILWTQNMEYIQAMQEALASATLEEAELIDDVLRRTVDSDKRFKESLRETVVSETTVTVTESQEVLSETFETTFGTLAEEASSDLVQQELAAMGQALGQAAQAAAERVATLTASLQEIAAEYAGVEITRDTPPETLNALLERFPKTGELKG